jgi:hypothetical protein
LDIDFFFADLGKLCAKYNLVFPAMDCFEQRLDNPTAYFVFYDNFLRAAEGEEKWKASASKSSTNERLSSTNNESFAMILLKNNYFAWLLEAKQEDNCLITDYDSEELISTAKHTLTEHLMGGICIEKEDGFHTVPTPKPQTESNEDDDDDEDDTEEYESATDTFNQNLQAIRERVRYSMDYKLILDSMKKMEEGDSYDNNEKTRKRKMRKIMKGLKQYTGARLGQEKAYRGWSNRTHQDMLEYMRSMKSDVTRYGKFEEEYRRLYAMRKVYSTDETQNHESEDEANNQETFDELFEIPAEFM